MSSSEKGRVPEAEEIVLQFERFRWDFLEPGYKKMYENTDYSNFFYEDPNYLGWLKRKQTLLESAGVRIREKSLMGKVVEPGWHGRLPWAAVYGTDWDGWEDCRVLSTKPDGEVRIAESTEIILVTPPERPR